MVRHGILEIVIFYLRYLSRDTPYNYQFLMVRHGILEIVILYLRYLSRGTPYNY